MNIIQEIGMIHAAQDVPNHIDDDLLIFSQELDDVVHISVSVPDCMSTVLYKLSSRSIIGFHAGYLELAKRVMKFMRYYQKPVCLYGEGAGGAVVNIVNEISLGWSRILTVTTFNCNRYSKVTSTRDNVTNFKMRGDLAPLFPSRLSGFNNVNYTLIGSGKFNLIRSTLDDYVEFIKKPVGVGNMCEAIQMSDQMQCAKCGLAWDVGDEDPPKCKTSTNLAFEIGAKQLIEAGRLNTSLTQVVLEVRKRIRPKAVYMTKKYYNKCKKECDGMDYSDAFNFNQYHKVLGVPIYIVTPLNIQTPVQPFRVV